LHVLRFEKTCPEDGSIRLDNKIINSYELLLFLQFDAPVDWYTGYFQKGYK